MDTAITQSADPAAAAPSVHPSDLPTQAPARLDLAEQRLQRNLYHLYADIAGFGLLAGSAIAFIAIYAARMGATNTQVGLLSAGPALINLLVTLPAGQWLAARPLAPVVFRTSLLHRLIYPLLIPLIFITGPAMQVWAIVLLVLLSSIPGTTLAIAFNAMFAEAVPEERRGEVVGRRNALLALTMLVSSLLSGQILRLLPVTPGYALVFALGALGAAYSSYHLWRIRLDPPTAGRQYKGEPLGDAARAGRPVLFPDAPLARVYALRMLTHVRSLRVITLMAPLRTAFGPFMVAMFAFHLAQFVPGPVFPLYWVRVAGLDDAAISVLNASFYTVMLMASLRLGSLTQRFGNRRLVIAGSLLLSTYPLFTGLSQNVVLLLVANVVGGATWAVLGGALSNRLMERVPEAERPSHFALYNLALNAAILIGSLAGAALADAFGLRQTLFIAAGLRVLAGLLLWRQG